MARALLPASGVEASMRTNWKTKACMFLLGIFAIWVAFAFMHQRHLESQALELTQTLESLDVGSSSDADVQRIQKKFNQYEASSEDRNGVHEVIFEISDASIARHAIHSGATLRAGVGTRDGKVVTVGVTFERQVTGGKLAAIVEEAREQPGSCQNSYCVGNPIGKRFIVSRLDMRATPEQKRRAFDLNLDWLIRLHGQAKICDLSPSAWREWKAQHPDDVPLLRATYECT